MVSCLSQSCCKEGCDELKLWLVKSRSFILVLGAVVFCG